jgi:hypothetical protein
MVEGAMRHGTSMEVEQNFVDSHGASFVGFGITRLLDFDLIAASEVVPDEPPLLARWLTTNETTTTAPMPARMFRTQWPLLLLGRGGCGGP